MSVIFLGLRYPLEFLFVVAESSINPKLQICLCQICDNLLVLFEKLNGLSRILSG